MKTVLALALVWALGAEAWLGQPPLGLDIQVPAPAENPPTRKKAALGRRLFFDTRLSRDGTLSCASCHNPKLSFSDGRARARGIAGSEGTRNSLALINSGYANMFFWDGRAQTLEQLALEPIFNPLELGNTPAELERRTGMRGADVANALATYLRTIRSGDSRFDRYLAGRTDALNALEKDGLTLFRGKGKCAFCHFGPTLTDDRFHNTGVAWRNGRFSDEGRASISESARDRGAFKTPTLRDLNRTAPYMHDGSLATLEEVIEFYSQGGRPNPHLDPVLKPLNFSMPERHALVAFLSALTGSVREGH